MLFLFLFASVGLVMADTACNNSLADFYPETKCNLTQITWAHAVNSQDELSEALNDTTILMLEADIVIGTLNGSPEEQPIMAHPPATTSDLSLSEFLTKVSNYNSNTTSVTKGVKLDFKSIEALEGSKDVIAETNISYPLLINSDIISGPLNATTVPVNPERFFLQAKTYPNAMLSIGWTTNYGPDVTASYTEDQVQEMISAISSNDVTQEITFPVRAGIAAESIDLMDALVRNVSRSTLTIWSSDGDNVNVENLRKLIETVGLDKVFVDVPESLRNELKLDTINGGSGLMLRAPLGGLLAAAFFMLIF